MTKAKKAISVVLAVVMIAGLFAFGAFAADQNATITVSANKTQVEIDDTVTVTVAATTNYYAAAASVPVHYDTAAFDLVPDSVTPSTDLYGAGYTDTAINTAEAGCVMVSFIPKAGGTAKKLSDTTLFTFRLKAKADAAASAINTKAEDQKADGNMGGKLYLGAYPTEDVNTSDVTTVGQKLTLNDTTVTVGDGAAEPNTLAIKDAFAGKESVYIDKDIISMITADDWYPVLADAVDSTATGLVYGIDTIGYDDVFASDSYPTLEDALTTTLGDEYLRITTVDAAGGYASTGAKIEVLDANKSTVLETYYFVYFGDINGDAYVDGVDAAEVAKWDYYQDSLSTVAAVVASDYNGDSYMDGLDFSVLAEVDYNQENYPTQAELAAGFHASVHGM